MRSPFILRSTHDALMAAKDARIAELNADRGHLTVERLRAIETHDAFVALIAERATPPARPVPAPVRPPREPDAADGAIALASAFDPRRRRHLEQYARARRQAGASGEEIAQEVLHPKAEGAGEWEMPE